MPFAPGKSGNPFGRPKVPEDVNELKKLNQTEIRTTLNKFLQLTPFQLKKVQEDPESTMLELFVISVITHGVNRGDPIRLEWLVSRLIGKMKERFEVEDKSDFNTVRDQMKAVLLNPEAAKALSILEGTIQIERRHSEISLERMDTLPASSSATPDAKFEATLEAVPIPDANL